MAAVTRASRAITLAAGLGLAWTLLPVGAGTAAIAVAGTVVCLASAARAWSLGVTVGGAALVGAVVLAGWQGLGFQSLVLGTVGAVVAWDASANAVGLTRQVETDSQTRRVVGVHTGLVLAVTAGVAAVVTLAFVLGNGVVPAAGALPVVAGAVLVAAGLGPGLE